MLIRILFTISFLKKTNKIKIKWTVRKTTKLKINRLLYILAYNYINKGFEIRNQKKLLNLNLFSLLLKKQAPESFNADENMLYDVYINSLNTYNLALV